VDREVRWLSELIDTERREAGGAERPGGATAPGPTEGQPPTT
jgi:hypothetical protein